jgi:uncharacterized membrane protein
MAELVVLAFQDEATAEQALAALQRLEDEGKVLTLRDWALVVRGEGESVRVVRSSDPPATSGRIAFAGGAMGAIIGGLLFVPVAGLMVGTLIGATMGRRRETGVDPTFAQDLSAALDPGTAALFLYVVANDADRAIAGVKPFSPRVVRTSLSAQDEAALRSRFEAASSG